MFQGDIELGASVEERETSDRSTLSAGRDTGTFRWPDNTVIYADYTDLPAATQSEITQAMQHWTQTTSVRFRLRDTESAYVVFSDAASGCFSSIGRQGTMQTINLNGCSLGSTIHEIGHAVGLFHEQSRTDRDGFVFYDPDCVDVDPDDKRGNFNELTNGVNYGLYDFDSIMHYGSTAFFTNETPPASCSSALNTLWRRSSAGTAQDAINHQRTALSVIDRQGVEEMYSEGLGQSVAVGDFNGDGYRDVAVGAPRDGAGRVRVYRGSSAGLTFTDELSQGIFNDQAEDRFGYSLAAADFNNDGYTDLAVGVPGENGRTGRVIVYRGRNSATNLVDHLVSFDQSALAANESGDRFGYALAAGDIDNDGYADLAVGAPGEAVGERGGVGRGVPLPRRGVDGERVEDRGPGGPRHQRVGRQLRRLGAPA
jgi:hypothetical protein